jgi:hypothetical protein
MPVDDARVSLRRFDLSRETFDPEKHYRSVVSLQGRPSVEADDNEQRRIDLHRSDTTTDDVIGDAGYPKGTTGFAITANGNDLAIGAGRMYVGGLLCENESSTASLLNQPDLPAPASGLAGVPGFVGKGAYNVILDVFERDITMYDDGEIREKALGGTDHAARVKTLWQVRLVNVAPGTTCATAPPLTSAVHDGELMVRTNAAAATRDCTLPPLAGYQSRENQAYRFEIQAGGAPGVATFKWSRENGSVVTPIVATPQSGILGQQFQVQSLPADSTLTFANNQFVELTDDIIDLNGCPGIIAFIQIADPATRTITLSAAPSGTIDLARNPKMRRWDWTDASDTNGVPTQVPGNWVDIESGIQVQFTGGTYQPLDYWIVPARTAIDEQTGALDYPTTPQSAQYVEHRQVSLAIVTYNGAAFDSTVQDCRLAFPPLTAITASDVSYQPGACPLLAGATTVQQALDTLCQENQGPCTLVLDPSEDWGAEIAALFGNAPALDAELCFKTGSFTSNQPVVVATTGNVKVSGAGWGTRLVGTGVESVLQFKGCASVSVRDLSASADTVNGPPDATTKSSKFIHGALDFDACADVLVENVSLSCGSAISAGAACLTARNDPTVNPTTGTGTVRIYGSQLTVGEMQYGILLVHPQRAYIEGNRISGVVKSSLEWGNKIQNQFFQRELVHTLIGNPVLSSAAATAPPPTTKRATRAKSAGAASIASAATGSKRLASARQADANVTVSNTTVSFNAPTAIKNVFQTYIDNQANKEFATAGDLYKSVESAAYSLISDPAQQAKIPSFQSFMRKVQQNEVPVALRGIAIGGQAVSELRIQGNLIENVQQGMTVGVSHKEKRPPSIPANSLGHVTIYDNVIHIVVNVVQGHNYARWGIFVGNATDVTIANNDLSLVMHTISGTPFADGIRLYGYLGRRAVISRNDISGFWRDIFVRAMRGPGQKNWFTTPPGPGNPNLWLVTENVSSSSSIVIDAPACTWNNNMP